MKNKVAPTLEVDANNYSLVSTASGWAVQRQDRAWAEFLGEDEATEAIANLRSGKTTEKDYDWLER